MQTSRPHKYSRMAKVIHWGIAALILLMVAYGWSLDDQEGAALAESLSYHALGGFMVLVFAVLRLSWRIGNPPPPLSEDISAHQVIAAKAVHFGLYALMFVVPLTGLVAGVAHEQAITWPGGFNLSDALAFIGSEGFELKRAIHAQSLNALLLLILGHIAAACVHQFWLKDGLMHRMLADRQV